MKESRRVILTKKMLRDSLCELLEKNNIHKISIKQICETADVNRTTFYAHYCDRYALLRDVENEVEKKAEEELNKPQNYNREKALEQFFKFIIDNIEKLRLILKNGLDNKFIVGLAELSVKIFTNDEKYKKIKEETREFIYQYIINGSLSIIEKLIGNEISKTPKELASMFNTLVNGSINAFCCA